MSLNKRQMLRFARQAGIGMPATAFPAVVDDIDDGVRGFRPPLIVKGIRGDSSRHLRVCRSLSIDELKSAYSDIAAVEQEQGISDKPLVQEYVTGDVYSAIVLADQGTVRACFMMKKIRTYPSWGGICVEGESVHDEAAMAAVTSFFDKVPWHGIAEIEFILDAQDGGYKFVELNPDFNWGLDFAVHAGVDFPMLACQMMQGRPLAPPATSTYRSGRRFVWFLPEGVKYLRHHPAAIPGLLWKALRPGVGTDLYLRDFGALARQVKRLRE
jgi:predicted ATP-grasp superfamily ATP-dependent carboligase